MTHIDADIATLLRDARWRIANKDTSTDEYKRLDAPVVVRIDAALATYAVDASADEINDFLAAIPSTETKRPDGQIGQAKQSSPTAPNQIVIRTLAEYRSHFIAVTGREPTAQEVWDTAHWSGLFRTCFTGAQAPVTEDVRERLDRLADWLEGHDHKRTAADLRSLMAITVT
ncbi:hypothetical protein [Ralstonia solanacearum]|uniref:hypothetical protein n=1 Tax=Ralstonia solanacearum TaxID=305 RepID=UPI00168AD39A|nr:hypothetical protein [Ralstonia solanacearum]QNT25347.1 hypothetical protein C2I38_25130 [Ralstonia solanacearum]QNT62994.1 hypothetical protein C2L97_25175 [Ralstonia solanacearum]